MKVGYRSAVASVLVLMAGCSTTESARIDWRNVQDSSAWRDVVTTPETCNDCLHFSEVAELGDDAGGGLHNESHWATIDSLGNYWIGDVDGPRVYTSDGRFRQKVGREGQGPLEFAAAGPIFTDSSGNVHVLDPRNQRESVVAQDFSLVRDSPLPPGWVYESLPISGTPLSLVSAVFHTADLLGYPLHVVRGAEIVRSFGMKQSGVQLISTMSLLRRLAIAPTGEFFSAGYFDYAVEAWTQDGHRISGWRRAGLWNPPPDGVPQPMGPTSPPGGLFIAMRVDRADRLWTITWVPRDNWRDGMREVELPDGAVAYQPVNSNASIYTTAIEVIDLASGEILARSELDERVEGFMGGDRMYGNRLDEQDVPQLVVWTITPSGRLAERGGREA